MMIKHVFSRENNYWQEAPLEQAGKPMTLQVGEPQGREIRALACASAS